ncbi:class I SAM-dependent methyltransferase [Planctomicrobium sp. SH668]|uniref:class I SAM-dependent methyltransferase n=1 Tax=Planctomicrobium sp. SH668 TaxID=3448126 RepID=UPI003F5AEFD7
MNNHSDSADPTPILDLLVAYRRSKAMFAGVKLGVFDELANGPKTASELASSLPTSPVAVTRLLDALVGLQLLQRAGESYQNSAAASAYLTTQSPQRMTGYINYSNRSGWKLWGNLEDSVIEGSHRWTQTFDDDKPIFTHFYHDEESKREFLMGMHGFGLISSPHVVAAFDLSRFKTIADLGGATGHLAVAACRLYPHMEGIVLDLPEVTPFTREMVASTDVASRVTVADGDFFETELPQADLFALGRIIHDWSEEKSLKLLRKIHAALPLGGGLLLAEKMINPERNGPEWALLQDLNMLVCTEGRERTLEEYRLLLQSAGFQTVQGQVTESPADAILAVK